MRVNMTKGLRLTLNKRGTSCVRSHGTVTGNVYVTDRQCLCD